MKHFTFIISAVLGLATLLPTSAKADDINVVTHVYDARTELTEILDGDTILLASSDDASYQCETADKKMISSKAANYFDGMKGSSCYAWTVRTSGNGYTLTSMAGNAIQAFTAGQAITTGTTAAVLDIEDNGDGTFSIKSNGAYLSAGTLANGIGTNLIASATKSNVKILPAMVRSIPESISDIFNQVCALRANLPQSLSASSYTIVGVNPMYSLYVADALNAFLIKKMRNGSEESTLDNIVGLLGYYKNSEASVSKLSNTGLYIFVNASSDHKKDSNSENPDLGFSLNQLSIDPIFGTTNIENVTCTGANAGLNQLFSFKKISGSDNYNILVNGAYITTTTEGNDMKITTDASKAGKFILTKSESGLGYYIQSADDGSYMVSNADEIYWTKGDKEIWYAAIPHLINNNLNIASKPTQYVDEIESGEHLYHEVVCFPYEVSYNTTFTASTSNGRDWTKAYLLYGVEDDYAVLKELSIEDVDNKDHFILPANTPAVVITGVNGAYTDAPTNSWALKFKAGTYELPVKNVLTPAILGANLENNDKAYIFNIDASYGAWFTQASNNAYGTVVPLNSAYLTLSKPEKNSYYIDYKYAPQDPGAVGTAINTPLAANADKKLYDLNGRLVTSPVRGNIYINAKGQKVMKLK